MLFYVIGAVCTSLLTVLAGLALAYRFYAQGVEGSLLGTYGLCLTGFTVADWVLVLRHHGTIQIRAFEDLATQVLALLILASFNRRMGQAWAARLTWVLYSAIAILSLAFTGDVQFTRMLLGVLASFLAMLTIFSLHAWEDLEGMPFHRTPEFWVITAFMLAFPSQVAKGNYLHLLQVSPHMNLVWLYFSVSILPEALTAVYLGLAASRYCHE